MKRTASGIALFVIGTFVLPAVLLSSCKKPNYNELSEEDLEWIIYRNNDTVAFRSNAGNTMTFIFTNHSRYYVHEGNNYYEGTSIRISLKEATVPDDGLINVQLNESGTQVSLSWAHCNKNADLINTPQVTDTVYGKVYKDLYIITAATTSNYLFIEKLYYSKTAGLVRFEDRYGYTWKNLEL